MNKPRIHLFPFALIPAAGASRRMGVPKLLLDAGGRTVIARLLEVLAQAGITRRFVVVNASDKTLQAEVEKHSGLTVVPETPPPDMRASVSLGLQFIAHDSCDHEQVADPESPWLLVPADHPVVLAEIVSRLLSESARHPGRIIIPTHKGRRGHPTVFAWKHAVQIGGIPPGQGLNWLVRSRRHEVVEVEVESDCILLDLDTPEDYERLRGRWPP